MRLLRPALNPEVREAMMPPSVEVGAGVIAEEGASEVGSGLDALVTVSEL